MMTTRPYKLTPFTRQRKYFFSLIFFVEGNGRKFFLPENFSIYRNFFHYSDSGRSDVSSDSLLIIRRAAPLATIHKMVVENYMYFIVKKFCGKAATMKYFDCEPFEA